MPIFVIQKHYARRTHYDLRLEMNGVLKSWAIPKEPPTKPGIKRLAIEMEDHELSYADFEGVIPEGMYGAGKVEMWDRGEYEMDEKEDGELAFFLRGKKLNGRYCLVRFEKDKWFFFRC
ncbi:MAG: 3'-phosphoesterase [Thermoplasmata archaeon]|nr:3'-phosphoesterase [Thermoplasmata archaeon]